MIEMAGTPKLETERLILRGPKPDDWQAWMPFAMSERAQYIGGPYDLGGAWRAAGHFVGHWLMRGYGSFVITRKGDDTAIGMTGPWYPANWPEKELGWTMWQDDLEGTGLMFEAASAARDYAFDVLGWQTAVSYIDAPNVRSIRLAERLGAVHDPEAECIEIDKEVLVYRHDPARRRMPSSGEAVGPQTMPSSSEAVGPQTKPSSSEAIGQQK
jgi:RimJ/RimL family protein N-acetyltransferase